MPHMEKAQRLSKRLGSGDSSREYKRLMEREVMLETTAESLESLTPVKTSSKWAKNTPDPDNDRSWDKFHDLLLTNKGERARTTKK